MTQRTEQRETRDVAEDRDQGRQPAGRGTRVLWGVVVFLAAVLLLLAVTMASVAMLVPDALTGDCLRPQLVRPEECAPNLEGD